MKKESLARSASGVVKLGTVNFVIRASNQLVEELGAQTNVHASGNAITSGDSLGQPPSVVRSIAANNQIAQPSDATAKSITSLRATAVATALVAIIT